LLAVRGRKIDRLTQRPEGIRSMIEERVQDLVRDKKTGSCGRGLWLRAARDVPDMNAKGNFSICAKVWSCSMHCARIKTEYGEKRERGQNS